MHRARHTPTERPPRLPRTRQVDITRHPAHTRHAQPLKFDRFREACTFQRPDEALAMHTPVSRYDPSPCKMPNRLLPPLAYPDRFEVRYVSANEGIQCNRQWVNVSITYAGDYVRLEAFGGDVWHVDLGPLTRCRLLA